MDIWFVGGFSFFERPVSMWPSISVPFGTQSAQVYTYSILIGLGLCHLLLGVDATGRRTYDQRRNPADTCTASESPVAEDGSSPS